LMENGTLKIHINNINFLWYWILVLKNKFSKIFTIFYTIIKENINIFQKIIINNIVNECLLKSKIVIYFFKDYNTIIKIIQNIFFDNLNNNK